MMAFVYSLRQWAELTRDERASRDVQSVATLEPDVIALCERRGWDALDLSDCLPAPVMAANQEAAARACDALGERLAPHLTSEHRCLARHIAHDLLYPLAYALHLRDMLDGALDRYRPTETCVFGDASLPFFWDPSDMPPDFANAVTMSAISARGIRQHTLRAPIPAVHEIPENRRHVWIPACRVPTTPGARIALLHGLGWNEAAELLRPELQATAARPIHAVSMAWFSYVDFDLPYSELEIEAAAESAVREVSESNARLRMTLGAPLLRFQWTAWCGRIRESVRYFELGKWLTSTLRPSCVVLGYDIRGQERCLVEGILAVGGVPVSIHHSGINAMESEVARHRGAKGHLAVWSERNVALLRPYRAGAFRIEPTGSLRADLRTHVEGAHASRARYPMTMNRKPRVLFLTCRVGDFYSFTLSSTRHVAVWRELRQLCKRHPDWEFGLKRHPRYDHSAIYGLSEDSAPDNLVPVTVSLETALDTVDVVVLPNMETTAALEAMLRNIPTIFLDGASRIERATWLRTCGIKIVQDVASLESELEKLLSDPVARAEYGRACGRISRTALPKVGEGAVEAFYRFLDRVESESSAMSSQIDNDVATLWMLNLASWVDERMMHNPIAAAPRAPADQLLRSAMSRVNTWPRFGRQIIHRIVWYPWNPCVGFLVNTVWRAYCALPRAARPSFLWVRPYLLEAIRRDLGAAKARRMSRPLLRVLAAVLSPKTVIRGLS